MNRAAAGRLAHRWSNTITDENHPWGEDERTGRHRDAAQGAVWHQLQGAVPDADDAVITGAEMRDPTVAVLAGSGLYLIRVPGFDGERALTECRFFRVDPTRGQASVTSRHWSDGFTTVTGSEWHFEIETGATLAIRTRSSSDDPPHRMSASAGRLSAFWAGSTPHGQGRRKGARRRSKTRVEVHAARPGWAVVRGDTASHGAVPSFAGARRAGDARGFVKGQRIRPATTESPR